MNCRSEALVTTCTIELPRVTQPHPAPPAAQTVALPVHTIASELARAHELLERMRPHTDRDPVRWPTTSDRRPIDQAYHRVQALTHINQLAVELACSIAYALDGTPSREIRNLNHQQVAELITTRLQPRLDP